jgi:glycosyltransferase involved in cell wall biosynthesis
VRIILFSQALHPQYGGSAFSEASLAGSLLRAGNHVTVFCRLGTYDVSFVERFGKITVEPYTSWQWFWAWLQKSHPLRRFIRDADLVHLNGHWRWENHFIARVCISESKRFVLQPRGMLWLGHRKVLVKRLFNFLVGNFVVRHAARVIALSTFELEQWNRYPLTNQRVVVLPNGVVGAESKSEQPAITDLSIPEAGYFVYLGRLEARKNLVFLLTAFREFRRRGGKAELWLVGPSERGYDEVLRKAILHMGLVSTVRLQAPVFTQAKMEILKSALGLVYPAIQEPFGRVPFEALDAGTFSIVPKRSGSAEYIGPFLPECIYEDNQPSSLASAFYKLQRPDNGLHSRREQAQHWVQTELSWERVCGRYESLYRHAVSPANENRADEKMPSSASASDRS